MVEDVGGVWGMGRGVRSGEGPEGGGGRCVLMCKYLTCNDIFWFSPVFRKKSLARGLNLADSGGSGAVLRGCIAGCVKKSFVSICLRNNGDMVFWRIFLKKYFAGMEKGCIFAAVFDRKTTVD